MVRTQLIFALPTPRFRCFIKCASSTRLSGHQLQADPTLDSIKQACGESIQTLWLLNLEFHKVWMDSPHACLIESRVGSACNWWPDSLVLDAHLMKQRNRGVGSANMSWVLTIFSSNSILASVLWTDGQTAFER